MQSLIKQNPRAGGVRQNHTPSPSVTPVYVAFIESCLHLSIRTMARIVRPFPIHLHVSPSDIMCLHSLLVCTTYWKHLLEACSYYIGTYLPSRHNHGLLWEAPDNQVDNPILSIPRVTTTYIGKHVPIPPAHSLPPIDKPVRMYWPHCTGT